MTLKETIRRIANYFGCEVIDTQMIDSKPMQYARMGPMSHPPQPEPKFKVGDVITGESFYGGYYSKPEPYKNTGKVVAMKWNDYSYNVGCWEYEVTLQGYEFLTEHFTEDRCYLAEPNQEFK